MKKTKTKPKTVNIAYVRWFDSSMTGPQTIDPGDAAGTLDNETAGLLIAEDEESITLSLDRCIDTGGLRSTICIPKVNVRSIRRFAASTTFRRAS